MQQQRQLWVTGRGEMTISAEGIEFLSVLSCKVYFGLMAFNTSLHIYKI